MGAAVVSINRSGRPQNLHGDWLSNVEWVQVGVLLGMRGRQEDKLAGASIVGASVSQSAAQTSGAADQGLCEGGEAQLVREQCRHLLCHSTPQSHARTATQLAAPCPPCCPHPAHQPGW